MRLLLMRHAETDWVAANRFQGQTDVPLNTHGRRQAAALAHVMAGEAIHVLYASDLQRAWETAQAVVTVRPHAIPLQAEPRLREMHFGRWEGLTYDEIQQQEAAALAIWEGDLEHTAPPGGETLLQMAERVRAVYTNIRQAHAEQTVALVAHGGPLQVLLTCILGLPARDYWHFALAPTSISEVHFYDAGPILTRLNDTHHLRGLDHGC